MFELERNPVQFGVQQTKWLGQVAQQNFLDRLPLGQGVLQNPATYAPQAASELARYIPKAYSLGKTATQKTLMGSKPFLQFGVGFAEELIYGPNQRRYVDELPFTAPFNRMNKAARTALSSLKSDKQNDIKRGTFAALELATAVSNVAEIDLAAAAKEAPVISEVVAMLPDNDEGRRIAEQVTAVGLAPVVDAYNKQIIPFRRSNNPASD